MDLIIATFLKQSYVIKYLWKVITSQLKTQTVNCQYAHILIGNQNVF